MKNSARIVQTLYLLARLSWNIETYEDVEGELSHYRTYNEFLERIQIAGANCYRILKPGGSVCGLLPISGKMALKCFIEMYWIYSRSRVLPHGT